MKNATIKFDSTDWQGMLDLMNNYGDTDCPFYGKNDEGEDISISVFHDKIVTVVNQNNGWIRKNIYHKDRTWDNEELFEGRWR